MELSDKIRIIRKARGYSQEELGEKLSKVSKYGVSRQSVSDWENGKSEPIESFIGRKETLELIQELNIIGFTEYSKSEKDFLRIRNNLVIILNKISSQKF